jgi:hypothetical protein
LVIADYFAKYYGGLSMQSTGSLYVSQPRRRKYERYYLETKARIISPAAGETSCLLKDISSRGAGILSNHPLNLQAEVRLLAKRPPELKQPATVIWCREIKEGLWRAGLDFGEDNKLDFSGRS